MLIQTEILLTPFIRWMFFFYVKMAFDVGFERSRFSSLAPTSTSGTSVCMLHSECLVYVSSEFIGSVYPCVFRVSISAACVLSLSVYLRVISVYPYICVCSHCIRVLSVSVFSLYLCICACSQCLLDCRSLAAFAESNCSVQWGADTGGLPPCATRLQYEAAVRAWREARSDCSHCLRPCRTHFITVTEHPAMTTIGLSE